MRVGVVEMTLTRSQEKRSTARIPQPPRAMRRAVKWRATEAFDPQRSTRKKGPSTMAQTPQSERQEAPATRPPMAAGGPQGLFGGSTTILLLIFAVAVFWWSRRRRVEMEERLRTQRREAEASAQRPRWTWRI